MTTKLVAATTARQTRWLIWSYLLLIAAGEALVAFSNPIIGLSFHMFVLLVLVLRGTLSEFEMERQAALTLIIAPAARILTLTLPLASLPQIFWYPFVLLPLLFAAWLVIRQLRLARVEFGLDPGNLLTQLLIAGGGLGLGAAHYLQLRPEALVTAFSWNTMLLATLGVLLAAGFIEELIFRGLLQSVALPALGRGALFYVALLFAVMQFGTRSLPAFGFALGVGLIFGCIVYWSRSLLGVAIAHGLANITVFVLMPFMAQQTSPQIDALIRSAIAAGTTLALGTFIFMLVLDMFPRRGPASEVWTGPQLRDLRRAAGLQYTDLAELAGISSRLLAEIECGLLPLDVDLQKRLANALGQALTANQPHMPTS